MRALLLVALLTGCSGSDARALIRYTPPGVLSARGRMYTDAQCKDLLRARRTWGSVGAGAAFAGGSGGLATAFPSQERDRYLVGAGSLLLGVGGAITMALSRSLTDDFNEFCTTSDP